MDAVVEIKKAKLENRRIVGNNPAPLNRISVNGKKYSLEMLIELGNKTTISLNTNSVNGKNILWRDYGYH